MTFSTPGAWHIEQESVKLCVPHDPRPKHGAVGWINYINEISSVLFKLRRKNFTVTVGRDVGMGNTI